MTIIDTHCHYNLEPIYPNWQKYWQKAQKCEVIKSIIAGSSLETSKKALEIATKDKNLFASIGIHPHYANQDNYFDLEKLALENKDKIIAIGETGLDYFFLDDKKTEQKKLFIQQIKLANKINKPLIIHVRDKKDQAYWDVLEILKNNFNFKTNFVLHCISGPLDYIKEAIKLGAYIGFDGNITYKNADNLRSILKITPKDKILLETDAPYLPPEPFRGKVCEPWMIKKTAEYMQAIGVNIPQTTLNAVRCFGLE
jgi:TatD DNase family protein